MSISHQTVVQDQAAAIQADLYMSFELSDKKWQLTLSDGRRGPGRYSVEAGDTAAVMQCIAKARERLPSSSHRPRCIPATKPGATAGGSTAG